MAKRIHFISGDPSPTLRCRIFDHRYAEAVAYESDDDHAGEEVEVCRRCMALRGASWDDVRRLSVGPWGERDRGQTDG